MQVYTYTHPKEIEYTGDINVFDAYGKIAAICKRKYDNRLKQKLDKLFDYRYFLKYETFSAIDGNTFFVRKISRRGRLWYEAFDTVTQIKYTISYENWRMGVPELYVTDGKLKIQINKEMEDWSEFLLNEKIIAKWKADFINEQFEMTLKIDESNPIKNVAFYVGICQATLFVGA